MPSRGQDESASGYYVYAVVPHGSALPHGVRGIDGAVLERIDGGSVAAVVTEIVLARPPGRSAELRAHGDVVDALAGEGPVVPAQFGAIMTDRAAVVDELLVPRQAPLTVLLDRLRDVRQFRVRATYDEAQVLAEVVGHDSEIAELQRRTRHVGEGEPHPDKVRLGELVSQALDRKRAEDAGVIMEVIRPWVEAEAPQAGGGIDHLHAVSVLVHIDRTGGFEEALEHLAEAVHERIHLALVGPMAPYDFVEGESWV